MHGKQENHDGASTRRATEVNPAVTRVEMNYEEFDAAIAAVDGHTTATGVQDEPFLINTLNVGDVSLQVFQEGGPNIYQGGAPADLISIFVGLPGQTAGR